MATFNFVALPRLCPNALGDTNLQQQDIKLHESWKQHLSPEFEKPYMKALKAFLVDEYKHGKCIYPPSADFFAAMDLTPLDNVKVVILGQDPYHGPGQAHGLSFSVSPGIPVPPSLVNIYKELNNDLGIPPANHGYLKSWAQQGVLLLNAVLSVEAHQAGSHRRRGWEVFTDRIIATVNKYAGPSAFVLWGAFARGKKPLIDTSRHLVIESPHPSPLSAHRGFFGTKPFSQINTFLIENRIEPINWTLSDTAQ